MTRDLKCCCPLVVAMMMMMVDGWKTNEAFALFIISMPYIKLKCHPFHLLECYEKYHAFSFFCWKKKQQGQQWQMWQHNYYQLNFESEKLKVTLKFFEKFTFFHIFTKIILNWPKNYKLIYMKKRAKMWMKFNFFSSSTFSCLCWTFKQK